VLDDFLPRYDFNEVHSVATLLRRRRLPLRGPLLEGFRKSGFVTLHEAPDELVLGGVGRFWEPTGGLRRIDAAEFGGFAEPGFAKTAFNFEIRRSGERTLLRTETRIATTDERSRRSFARYWRVVHPGSALIRLAWLRAIRKRAERASD